MTETEERALIAKKLMESNPSLTEEECDNTVNAIMTSEFLYFTCQYLGRD